jgi:uncharacterized protein involved in tolerance to divalent cations
MMPSDWVIIYTTNKDYQAEIIKSLLTDNEIECVSLNKQDSAYLFGEIEIYVSTTDALKAAQLIIQLEGE